jgi:hypothetical protein
MVYYTRDPIVGSSIVPAGMEAAAATMTALNALLPKL